MSTTDTILQSLTEQVRQLQTAIDWLDDHRQIIDQCETATTSPVHTYVYLHGGREPKALAKALGTKWERDNGTTICWWLTEPSFSVMKLCFWDSEECKTSKERNEVQL